MISDRYYLASFKDLYSRKCRRCLYSDYCSVDLGALPVVIHILIGIIPVLTPFVFILPLIEIARTQFFVRWVECNTLLPKYVLSCVFRFFDRIFRFAFCFCCNLSTDSRKLYGKETSFPHRTHPPYKKLRPRNFVKG